VIKIHGIDEFKKGSTFLYNPVVSLVKSAA
jgi:hypothetical protein